MSGEHDEGEPFGQFLPPFAQHLKENILQKYPDSGQILKELIQNADDAGATEVLFLLDHTDYNAKGVPSKYPELQKYQGPALYAFNNGVFQDQDWKGIRATEQGAKRKDPFRIGRFGIGFNSVYHITDVPSVMSGDYILILDPLSTAFHGGGRRFKISSLVEGQRYAEFLPFLGQLEDGRQYLKTLFRFPLRTIPSDLSDVVYTPARMLQRFNELLEDRDCLLLFLKNIEKVTFLERQCDTAKTVELATMTKAHGSRRQWSKFLINVSKGRTGIESCEPVTLTTIDKKGQEATSHWLVKNKVYDLASPAEHQLYTRLGVIPWVGVAMKAHDPPIGRVFCFLPLPSNPENNTGLPVHIHGYFGLSDNRRSVTWTSPDQQDDMTEWNMLLQTRLIPEVYAELLLAATNSIQGCHTRPSLIYNSWPNYSLVTERWQELVSQFAAKAVELCIFHTKALDGQWLHISEIYTNDMADKDIKRAVNGTLLSAGVNVAALPKHVKTIVAKAYYKPRSVSPTLVRATLKETTTLLSDATYQVKLQLLEYTLSDKSYKSMIDLPLLPLKSKDFTHFRAPTVASTVYLTSQRHPASLLPGIQSQLVDDDISHRISLRLKAMARAGVTQVHILTPKDVVKLLPSALPQHWSQSAARHILWQPHAGTEPPLTWLSTTWKWIAKESPSSLIPFEALPLLPAHPISANIPVILFPLQKFGGMLKKEGSSPPVGIYDIMEKVGINIVHSPLPPFISHSQLSTYVVPPTPVGVLSVLDGRETLVGSVLDTSRKVLLRDFLAKIKDDDLMEQHKIVLKSLPILECKKSTALSAPTYFTSAMSTSVAIPKDKFPEDIPLQRWLLSSYDSSTSSIVRLLKLRRLTLAELLIEDILPLMTVLPASKVQTLMLWILNRLDSLQSQRGDIKDHIKCISFVLCLSGEVCKPSELFDPTCPKLQELLAGEDVFPTGGYCTEPTLSRLKMLGLKTRSTLTLADVVKSAELVSEIEPCAALRKARMVFQYINKEPSSYTKCSMPLLERYEWLPCKQLRPDGYPNELGWYGQTLTAVSLENITDKTMIALVGSTMPILDEDPSKEFKSAFKWPSPPPLSKVVNKHLQAVIQAYTISVSGRGLLSDMAVQIYQYLADRPTTPEELDQELSRLCLTNWIWHGSDFTSPRRLAICSDITFSINPYLFILPSQLTNQGSLKTFFLRMGVSDKFGDEHSIRVLQDIQEHCGNGRSLTESELDLSIKIINFLTRNCSQPCTAQGLLVPTHDKDGETKLVPAQECIYCGSDFLREMGHESEMNGSFHMLHQSISPKMANMLGIKSLTHKIVQPKVLRPGMHRFGQKEPITRRLKTIIDEYKEGPGILYELIQNADDAGATEVKFAVDLRQNSEARKSLLSPGMSVCQGPALWAYNNQVFTDADIQNITEISGATKKSDTNKIGRFGLGFNSVYHITDVPSFVSRHYFVCFDPHTTHLSQMVDRFEPGVLIEWNKQHIRSIYRDQFQPYSDVFGCDIFDSDSYPATLFRLPFRTDQESVDSEISSTVYDRERMFKLLTCFAENLDTLLLFTQHVRSMTVIEIDEEGTHKELMHTESTIRSLFPQQSEDKQPGLLQVASSHMKHHKGKSPPEIPSVLNEITYRRIGTETTRNWVVSSCIGSAESLTMAQTDKGRDNGLLPCASVAAYLDACTNLPESVNGKTFCFLPLPESTGLPVHVNAPFAIHSNRQGICKELGSGMEQPLEVQWNMSLVRDAIAIAYLTLLCHLSLVQQSNITNISDLFCIWPNLSSVQGALFRNNLVPSLYENVVSSPSSPKVLLSLDKEWISMEEAIFLHPDVRESFVGAEALQMLHIWMDQQRKAKTLKQSVVDLPTWVFEGFLICAESGAVVERKALRWNTLYDNVFHPAVMQGYLANHRLVLDRFVLFLLDEVFEEHSAERPIPYPSLAHLPCVPCSPQGTILRCPSELVQPSSTIAKLFDEDDHRFPYGEELKKHKREVALNKLGMMMDCLPWELLLERAKSCEDLYMEKDPNKALNRMSFLYNFVMKTPGLNEKKANMTNLARIAVKQLLMVAEKPPPDLNKQLQGDLHTFCHAIYCILQRTCCEMTAVKGKDSISDDVVKSSLMNNDNGIPFIYINGAFVMPGELAFEYCGRAMKWLKAVPKELELYSTFLRCCGVRKYFEATDFVTALENMASNSGCNPLGKSDLDDALSLAYDLHREDTRLRNSGHPGIGQTLKRRVFLPDQKGVLRIVSELAYNDAPWLPEDPSIPYYVHPDIPRNQAVNVFGVETVRSKLVDQTAGDFCDIGEDFGQGEELTDRIRGILKSYSTGLDIFKELLQNADDAGATEVKFIYNTRQHSAVRIFDREWKYLQGPALLVYNNKTFSESDINAIQKLGQGNKQANSSAIGEFGVGFNAVYHLTDCPSFITDSCVMCVFDPHARYVPGATIRKPGRLIPVKTLADKFPDVLETFCVPNGQAPLEGSTLFRLPLRSKEMQASKITEVTFGPNYILSMMMSFWKEASQAILFLNNIEKVIFATVNGNDPKVHRPESYVEHYTVTKILSKEAKTKRQTVAGHIKGQLVHAETKLKSDSAHGILSIPSVQETYQVNIEEMHHRQHSISRWLISERVGFNKRPDLHSEELSFAKLKCIMPRVAVAALLEETKSVTSNTVHSTSSSDKFIGRAFCYLPLPVPTTCLPVHVNGHFALDSSRRNLASSDLHGQWNNLLKTELLAPAYFSLLVAASQELLHPTSSKGFSLNQYSSLFPVVNKETDPATFNTVAAEVYRIIANTDEKLIPVVKELDMYFTISLESCRDCLFEAQCDNANDEKLGACKKVLLSMGCKLVETKYISCMYENFLHAGIQVKEFTPTEVAEWLRTLNLHHLQSTCLTRDASSLCALLDYCLYPVRVRSQSLNSCLHDVPLLLAQDKNLYRFNKENGVYMTKYHTLVSASYKHKFVHESLLEMLSTLLQDDDTSTVVMQFDIKVLASLAMHYSDIIPSDCLIPSMGHNPWHLGKTTTEPSTKWIKLLWEFLDEEAHDEQSLHPIRDWQIIPSTRPSLFSLSDAKLGLVSKTMPSPVILDILEKLYCPFVNEGLLGPGLNIIHRSLASPTSSRDVVTVLEGVMKEGYNLEGILDKHESSYLLQHLQRDIDDLRRSPKLASIIKDLPVFMTLEGTLRSISGVREILVLESNFPAGQFNINTLLEQSGCVVLRCNLTLATLYEVFEVKKVSQVTLYVKHILPSFHLVSNDKQRMLHLTHIKDYLLPSLPHVCLERQQLLQKLQSTAFVPNVNCELVTADQFFDPYEPLFVAAQNHVDFIQFPPVLFCDETWLDFLREVGLQTLMDPHLFLQCAEAVEEQFRGSMYTEDESLHTLAKELVIYLFEHVDDLQHMVGEISETCFIPCHRPSPCLTNIHANAEEDVICFRGSVTSDCESLVWTTSLLLPEWSTPPDNEMKKLFGVEDSPSVDKVIDNCVNICSKGCDVDGNLCRVVESIYRFLQESCARTSSHCFEGKRPIAEGECDNCQLISSKLSCIPCVIVELDSSCMLSVGAKVVVEMNPDDKVVFQGYLHRLYRRLSPYEALLKCIGVTESVTLTKYALVLNELVSKYGSGTSLDEDTLPWKTACTAVGRIVTLSCGQNGAEQWQDFMSQANLSNLYLPTQMNTLEPSQNIVIMEGDICDPSILEKFDGKLLTPWLKLSRFAVESIPEDFRPVFLSDITEEKFSARSTPCKDGLQCPFRAFYAQTIQDEHFCRLLAKNSSITGKFTDKSELIPKVRERLASIQLHCYCTIELQLIDLQNEDSSSNEGKEMQVYLSVTAKAEGSSCLNMFLKHNAIFEEDSASMNFNLQLAKALCEVFKDYNVGLGSVLEELMKLQPTTEILDGIRLNLKWQKIQHGLIHHGFKLGSPVGQSRVSHRPDIDLQEGDIVAYRLPSAGQKEHIFHAIYAKLVKEEKIDELENNEGEDEVKAIASGEEAAPFQAADYSKAFEAETDVRLDFERIFEIDVNRDENLLVKVTDLYQFDEKQAVQVMTEAEALQYVTHVLEEAWELDEEDHTRVVSRLFLYWHPNHNQSDGDYAERVVGHIRDEIRRLLREDEDCVQGRGQDNQGIPVSRPRRSSSGRRRRSGRRRTGRADIQDSSTPQHQDVSTHQRKSHNRHLSGSDYDNMFSQLEELTIVNRTQVQNSTSGVGRFHQDYSRDTSSERQHRDVHVQWPSDYGEARRWFEQAKNDSYAANLCRNGGCNSNAAFMCHQAVEKSLKAAGFVVCGRQQWGHRLSELARSVASRHPPFNKVVDITYELFRLGCDNDKPRYPDLWASPSIPAAGYSRDDIDSMLSLTNKVLDHVSSLMR